MLTITGALRPAVAAVIFFTLLTGIAYPLVITGASQLLLADAANGSLARDADGAVVGSRLIGQAFTGAAYFAPRPSAAGDGYDASSSSGSNLGPTSAELIAAVEERVAAYRQANGLDADDAVPVDAVTTSGSGLDPHVSVANALLQAARVAEARGIGVEEVRTLIEEHTEGRALGMLGEPAVNVLELNLALDAAAPVDVGG